MAASRHDALKLSESVLKQRLERVSQAQEVLRDAVSTFIGSGPAAQGAR